MHETMKNAKIHKHNAYVKHCLEKRCWQCKLNEKNNAQFIFCDSCDDGYHWDCLTNPLTKKKVKQMDYWICPECRKKPKPEKKQKEKECFKCKRAFNDKDVKMIEALKIDKDRNRQKIFEILNHSILNCRFCEHYFHKECFSLRQNSLNCSTCEHKIRKSTPKDHNQFRAFVQKSRCEIEKSNFFQISQIENPTVKYDRLGQIRLVIYPLMQNWEDVCRAETSLYYALTTESQYFCKSQLYSSQLLLNLNQSHRNFQKPYKLSQIDEKVYKTYLQYIRQDYIPPLYVKEDRVKGFYAVAAQYIPIDTLLCEYVGEVVTRNHGHIDHSDNDSVMSLIVTDFAVESLDIVPIKFGGVSKFIMGIPSGRTELKNVETLNFSYLGRSHILFFTCKPIERQQPLYIEYNDGVFEEYPTQNFTV